MHAMHRCFLCEHYARPELRMAPHCRWKAVSPVSQAAPYGRRPFMNDKVMAVGNLPVVPGPRSRTRQWRRPNAYLGCNRADCPIPGNTKTALRHCSPLVGAPAGAIIHLCNKALCQHRFGNGNESASSRLLCLSSTRMRSGAPGQAAATDMINGVVYAIL